MQNDYFDHPSRLQMICDWRLQFLSQGSKDTRPKSKIKTSLPQISSQRRKRRESLFSFGPLYSFWLSSLQVVAWCSLITKPQGNANLPIDNKLHTFVKFLDHIFARPCKFFPPPSRNMPFPCMSPKYPFIKDIFPVPKITEHIIWCDDVINRLVVD